MGQILARSYEIWRGQRGRVDLPESRFQESAAVRGRHLEEHRNSDGGLWWGEYFAAAARDPVEAQFRDENIYRHSVRRLLDVLQVTIEIPYGGMVAHRGGACLRMPDLVEMHRDVAESLSGFFGGLRRAYDRAHPPERPTTDKVAN
jgi:hypothetical protein